MLVGLGRLMEDSMERMVNITMTESQARALQKALGNLYVADLGEPEHASLIFKFQRALRSPPNRRETTSLHYHMTDVLL